MPLLPRTIAAARRRIEETLVHAARAGRSLLGRAADYDAAASSRRQSDWNPSRGSANAMTEMGAESIRTRARDLVRNNATAARAIRSMVTSIVGTGIIPRPIADDPRAEKTARLLWDAWEPQVSTDTELGFYGLQSLGVRAWLESGEALYRYRPRRSADVSTGSTLAVPLQLQLMEADQLDWTRTERRGLNRVIQGVEFDALDRRVAYWLYQGHPGDNLPVGQYESLRVDASEIAHLYEPLRPGQARGLSWLTPVMSALRDLDGYVDAELVRKRTEACLALVVNVEDDTFAGLSGPAAGTNNTETSRVTDTAGRPIESLEPGLVAQIRNGTSFGTVQPVSTGGYAEYIRTALHGIAAGLSIPYEILSADLSQVNYSSYRAGWMAYRQMVEALQWHLVIPLVCAPTWRRFVVAAQAAGRLPDTPIRAEWQTPAWPSVDPEKDVRAAVLRLRSGLTSLQREIASGGDYMADVLAEVADANAEVDRLKLVLDCDPRLTTNSGQPRNASDPSARSILLATVRDAIEAGDRAAAADVARILTEGFAPDA